MTRKLTGVKPQDILILLKILVHNGPLPQTEMASELGLSGEEVSYGWSRLKIRY
jgi:DNA-binding Lrp family transcriptional regulator